MIQMIIRYAADYIDQQRFHNRPVGQRDALLQRWPDAPSALFAHPRAEHLIPLMVAAGGGGDVEGRHVFRDAPMGAVISAWRWD